MQYDFTLTANSAQVIDVAGKFFKYKSGIGAIRVILDKGSRVDLMPGQGVWGVDFTRLTVQDLSGVGNDGVLLAGSFDFRDDTISGNVSVVDGGKNRTKANQAFFMAAQLGTAPAGQFSYQELWNPAASGKNLIIEQYFLDSSAASRIYSGVSSARQGNGVLGVASKLAGGALSASLPFSAIPTIAVPAGGTVLATINVAANITQTISLREPIVVPPGWGFFISNTVATNDLGVAVEFFEEPIGASS